LTRRGLIAISYSNGNIRTLSDDPRNQIGYQEENEGQFIPITNPDGEEMEFKRDGYSIDSRSRLCFQCMKGGSIDITTSIRVGVNSYQCCS